MSPSPRWRFQEKPTLGRVRVFKPFSHFIRTCLEFEVFFHQKTLGPSRWAFESHQKSLEFEYGWGARLI